MTSQMYVIGGIVVAFLLLWWSTAKIKMRGREKDDRSAAMLRENSELRHVVTEMAKERHQHDDGNRGKSSR
jgi:hypothetical protein